jgi:hypothetical protein
MRRAGRTTGRGGQEGEGQEEEVDDKGRGKRKRWTGRGGTRGRDGLEGEGQEEEVDEKGIGGGGGGQKRELDGKYQYSRIRQLGWMGDSSRKILNILRSEEKKP